MQFFCGQCGNLSIVEGSSDKPCLVRCPKCEHGAEIDFNPSLDDEPFFSEEGEVLEEADPGYAQLAEKMLQERVLVICAVCGSKMKIARRLSGQVINCVSCSKKILVPDVGGGADLEELEELGMRSDGFEKPTLASVAKDARKAQIRKATKRYEAEPQGIFATIPHLKYYIYAGACALGVLILTIIIQALVSSYPTQTPGSKKPPVSKGGKTQQQDNTVKKIRVEMLSTRSSMLAPGTSVAAMPGMMYCDLKIAIIGGKDQRQFSTSGGAVHMSVGSKIYRSLGQVNEDAKIPVRTTQRAFVVHPGKTETAHLLFEVPAATKEGKLVIKGVEDNIPVTIPPAVDDVPVNSFVGEYQESGRSLKPLLENKVMRALQMDFPGRLSISKGGGDELRLDFLSADVVGTMVLNSGEAGSVKLKKQNSEVRGRVVLVPTQGGTLILYLSTRPMHQIVYRRKKR